jgi:alpha-1,3-glucan synthase
MTLWGEEQEFYVLENLADDYVFGRTPMGSSRAWQIHGCYHMSEELYYEMPFDPARNGCHDDGVSLDHRDPSHPTRNVIKRMYELRRQFPILNDGFNLLTLSTRLHITYLPGSGGLPSPFGIWSVYRGRVEGFQDFSGIGAGNQGVWFLYSNENHTIDYKFDCSSNNQSDTLV